MSPSCSISSPTLSIANFLKFSCSNGCKMVSCCVFMYIFLLIVDTENLLMSFLIIHISSFVKYLLMLLPILKIKYFYCWIVWILYIFCQTYIFKYFLPDCGLTFYFLNSVFWCAEFLFLWNPIYYFLWLMLFVLCLSNFYQLQDHNDILCFLLEAS